MTRLALVLLSACAAAAPMAPPPTPKPAPVDPRIAQLDAAAAEVVRATPLLGLRVAVVQHGRVLLDKAYGFADIEHRAPITRDTVFAIGSLTKQFTAAAVLQLVDAGSVKLDDPVATYVPQITAPVTIQQLLWQTAGLQEVVFAEKGKSIEQAIDVVAVAGTAFPPGTQWKYDNANYFILGRVIEQASGQPYAEYLHDHVFRAADLRATTVCTTITGAAGATIANDGLVAGKPFDLAFTDAAGAICSTAGDLLRWQRALFGGKIVSARALAIMTDDGRLADGTPTHYGAGLITDAVAKHRRIWHNGALSFGYQSQLAFYPDDDLQIALLANTFEPRTVLGKLEPALAHIALGIAPPRLDTAAAAAVAGTYGNDKISIELRLVGGVLHVLVAQDGEDHVVAFAAADVLAFEDTAALTVHVVREADRVVALELLKDGKVVVRLPRQGP